MARSWRLQSEETGSLCSSRKSLKRCWNSGEPASAPHRSALSLSATPQKVGSDGVSGRLNPQTVTSITTEALRCWLSRSVTFTLLVPAAAAGVAWTESMSGWAVPAATSNSVTQSSTG